jgi:5'(3')-deoxyribonucleotidase
VEEFMKKIGFIGAFDKTDYIIYIARLLTLAGKKVILIDSTVNQKAKYIIPAVMPIRSYVTEYQEFDVSVGFYGFGSIEEYLYIDNIENSYDVALIDVDSPEVFANFDMEYADINYFVTSFDMFSLRKGLEAISGLKEITKFKKVLIARDTLKQDNDYLNFLSEDFKLIWDDEIICFKPNPIDANIMIENQRSALVSFKNLSQDFIFNIMQMAGEIGEISSNELKKILKLVEKGV